MAEDGQGNAENFTDNIIGVEIVQFPDDDEIVQFPDDETVGELRLSSGTDFSSVMCVVTNGNYPGVMELFGMCTYYYPILCAAASTECLVFPSNSRCSSRGRGRHLRCFHSCICNSYSGCHATGGATCFGSRIHPLL